MTKIVQSILFLFLSVVVLCQMAFAQQPQNWEAFPARFNGYTQGLYVDTSANELYILGYFNQVDSSPCNVVKWDGSQTTLLPKQRSGITGVATVYKGKLIVSGDGGLATFDGTSWTLVDSGNGGSVECMEYYGGKLVLTGMFNKIAGTQIGKGAIWDGDKGWSDLFRLDTLLNDPSWSIGSFVVYKNQIYVAGNINVTGKPQFDEIARFDGQQWIDVGGGMKGNGWSGIDKMLIWNDELYVAGEFFERDGSPGNCIAKWDGNSWHRLGDGITDTREAAIYDMAVYHDNLYIVGPFSEAGGVPADGIARWDGKKWCSLGSDFDNTILSIENYKGELYVAGGFKKIDGDTTFSRLVKWIGGDYTEACGEPLGVERIVTRESLVFPNPAGDVLHLKIEGIQDVRIYDVAGKMVKTADKTEIVRGLDISKLLPGFYLVQVVTTTETQNATFHKL